MNNNLIAIGVKNSNNIWSGHFGMAPVYHIYSENGTLIEKRTNPYSAVNNKEAGHHDNPKLIVELLNDCNTFIAKRMGEKSKQNLVNKLGVKAVITTEDTTTDALNKYIQLIDK